MTNLITKKLVAAIVLTIGLFGALIGRVEAHNGGEHFDQGTVDLAQVESYYNSDLGEYMPRINVQWSFSALPNNVESHNPNHYRVEISIWADNNNLLNKEIKLLDLHRDYSYTFVTDIDSRSINWGQEYVVILALVDYYSPYCSSVSCSFTMDGTRIWTPTTPLEPEPPTEPETPNPSGCTYEHRLIGVPGTTGGGYTSQILIGSKQSNATASIRAFQSNNGHPIDVINLAGEAIGSTTSLVPANSVKVFKLEGARGWHTVIVEHPSKAAMDNATVAMRLREPNGGVSIEHVQGIERCVTAGTNTN